VLRSVATADGRTLTVREGGDPGGVPVLVQNGTPGSSMLYEPHLRDAEEKGIRLISYDRPGYGGSSRHQGRSVADCVADIATICDALGIGRFCTWGVSGGGPHALATAALLPVRVAAAGVLAPVAPFDAEGLDFYEGMGEQNVDDLETVLAGEQEHLAAVERNREQLLAATPEQLVDVWKTLLGPADVAILDAEVAGFILEHVRAGIEPSWAGWFDDEEACLRPWGFELSSIGVPVLHLQGEQDKIVPFGHGVWLSKHIPGVDSRLSPEDGHLTLYGSRIPEVHAWLLERYDGKSGKGFEAAP
jgi:pimeloyl-ACP methyl ester carboxylesterase